MTIPVVAPFVDAWKLSCMAVAWLCRSLRRHPKVWAGLVLLAGLTALAGRDAGLVVYLLPLLPAWRVWHPESFRRFVGTPWREARRRRRYESKWGPILKENGLTIVRPKALDAVPRILKVRCRPWGDEVTVEPLIGQLVETWRAVQKNLASDLGMRSCRAFEQRKERHWPLKPRVDIRLEFAPHPDPLAETIPALAIPESSSDIDLRAIPVGLTEQGTPWTIDVLLHLLLAGQTGSGKSGVLQGLLRGLAPMIRDGLVVVWAIDPKEGLEFGPAREMFGRYEDGTDLDFAALLGDAVTWCQDRGRRMAKRGERMHTPSLEEPLVLVVIDELADLTDKRGKDTRLANQLAASINHLLRKGRAKGFIVIGALTDPRVEVLPMRRGFPYRIGLRLDTRDETVMIMGDGARERGAYCEEIDTWMQGVGYAMMDGDRDAVRVRAAYVTDDEIAEMVAEYAPKLPEPVEVG